VAGQKFRTGGRIFSFIDLTKRQMDLLRGAFGKKSIGLEAGLRRPGVFQAFWFARRAPSTKAALYVPARAVLPVALSSRNAQGANASRPSFPMLASMKQEFPRLAKRDAMGR
jgi:hypothetical protein